MYVFECIYAKSTMDILVLVIDKFMKIYLIVECKIQGKDSQAGRSGL